MAENAGKGITRYTAGLFKTFNMANEAKGSIRSIGYSDAFVVAFFNGKRISMTKAREMFNKGTTGEGSLAKKINGSNNTTNSNTSSNIRSTNQSAYSNRNVGTRSTEGTATTIGLKPRITTREVKDGKSKDVRNIEGVFFTIQVGVYSKEVTDGQLTNLSDLNSERTESGLIRYTSGIFKTVEDANAVKERIRRGGITDAFVTAYSNGVRTTVAAAKEKLRLNVTVEQKEDPVIESSVAEEVIENVVSSDKVVAQNLKIKF